MSKKYWNAPKLDFKDQFYLLEIGKGLWLTFSIAAKNLFTYMKGKKGAHTIYYPEEKRADYAENTRGRHYLTKLENGRPKCIGCRMCATICPVQCISMEIIPTTYENDSYAPKLPKSFDIDLAKCIFCGFCVEVCPKDAIKMKSNCDGVTSYTREEMMIHKEKLLELSDE